MPIYRINPLCDDRWNQFVNGHSRGSVFHTAEWLSLLRDTYNYEPVAYTAQPGNSPLAEALVFCGVHSWITGARLVSLPFSDHCEPLVDGPEGLSKLFSAPFDEYKQGKWRYLELRPLATANALGLERIPEEYLLHVLDLRPSLDELYRSLHVDSIRRKIQRGEREGLTIESGNSSELLTEFYRLHLATRRRQQLPPHPFRWFRNLLRTMGHKATIRIAKRKAVAIAAVLTLSHNKCLTYKYGCSDSRFHNLGGMPFVFWDMIRHAKSVGMEQLDLGRSAIHNSGLVTFKDRWGTSKYPLIYGRYPAKKYADNPNSVHMRIAKYFISKSPDRILKVAGNWLYPHIG